MNPLTRIRRGASVALRRRYGYAGLRALRRAVRAALRDHRARQLNPARPYSTSGRTIAGAYMEALRRLRKKWPQLDPTDPRADLDQ